jgi:hypothetical protein
MGFVNVQIVANADDRSHENSHLLLSVPAYQSNARVTKVSTRSHV